MSQMNNRVQIQSLRERREVRKFQKLLQEGFQEDFNSTLVKIRKFADQTGLKTLNKLIKNLSQTYPTQMGAGSRQGPKVLKDRMKKIDAILSTITKAITLLPDILESTIDDLKGHEDVKIIDLIKSEKFIPPPKGSRLPERKPVNKVATPQPIGDAKDPLRGKSSSNSEILNEAETESRKDTILAMLIKNLSVKEVTKSMFPILWGSNVVDLDFESAGLNGDDIKKIAEELLSKSYNEIVQLAKSFQTIASSTPSKSAETTEKPADGKSEDPGVAAAKATGADPELGKAIGDEIIKFLKSNKGSVTGEEGIRSMVTVVLKAIEDTKSQ
jgi:hypothetical protein